MMLQTIREHTQGWIAGTIISIIILTFALWGIHSYFVGGGNTDILAEVNGIQITKHELSLAYERARRQMQGQIGPKTSGMRDDATLKSRALQSLIDIEILKQASVKQGYQVSNAQIDSYLQSMPDFQVNGEFSLEKFQQVLSSTLLSTGEFIELVKTSLMIDQPKLGIIFTSFALPNETENVIGLVNQERDISFIMVPLAYFTSQPMTITPEQIQAYYNQHQSEFMTEEQVSIDYLLLTLKDISSKLNPTEAELKNFYNENINAYTTLPTKGNNKPVIADYASVKDKVRATYIRQHAEEKFAQAKDQLSDITYEHPESLQLASKTLNLPIVSSELFSKNKTGGGVLQSAKVRDAAFSNDVLNLQNNSDVIPLDPDTFIVMHVKSHVPSSLMTLNMVTAKITEKLKLQEAEARAQQFMKSIVTKLQSGEDAQQVAATNKFTWHKVGYIGRYSTKVDSAILDTAFRLPNPTIAGSRVIYGATRLPNGGYALVALHSIKQGTVADQKQATVFAEQVQNSDGLLEYELYKQSVGKKAKVKMMQQS